MLESLLILLLYIALAALVVRLVIWVLVYAEIPIPPKIIWGIFAVVIVIMLVRFLLAGDLQFPALR